jgi:hypothetical protein
MKRIILIHSFFVCLSQFLIAQSDIKLSKDSLHLDIDFIYSKICEIHPDPFMRFSFDAFTQLKDSINNSVNENETIGTFYFKAASLISSIKDGHTTMLMPSFPASKNLRYGNNIFPLDIKIIENKVYAVFDHFYKDSISGEIVSINNISLDSLMKPIFNANSFDKYPDINYKSIEGDFLILLNELHGSDSIYKIELKGMPKTHVTHGISFDNLMKQNRYVSTNHNPYKLSTNNNTVISQFENFIPNDKLHNFIDSLFQIVISESIDTLIIDVRGNKGGSSNIISTIISHLTLEKFKIYNQVQIKISTSVKERFEKKDTVLSSKIFEMENSSIYNMELEYIEEQKENIFNGKLIVLTDRSTYSAGSTFAHLIENMELGEVFGETGCDDIYFGEFVFLSLPYTNLNFTISTKKLYEWRSENPKKSRN